MNLYELLHIKLQTPFYYRILKTFGKVKKLYTRGAELSEPHAQNCHQMIKNGCMFVLDSAGNCFELP